MDAFSAVHLLAGFEAFDAGTGTIVERLIVVYDGIVGYGDGGCIRDENAFKVGLFDGKTGDMDLGQLVAAIPLTKIPRLRPVASMVASSSSQRQGFGDDDIFFVGAGTDEDDFVWRSGSYGV